MISIALLCGLFCKLGNSELGTPGKASFTRDGGIGSDSTGIGAEVGVRGTELTGGVEVEANLPCTVRICGASPA